MTTSLGQISAWGNGSAVRLTKAMLKVAGVVDGTPVRIVVKRGRIVIDAETEPTLEDMLALFDAKRHGGEVMAFAPLGLERL